MLFVETKCAQQCEHAHTALTCDASSGGDVLAWLVFDVEFEPLTAVRVNGALDQLVL